MNAEDNFRIWTADDDEDYDDSEDDDEEFDSDDGDY